MKFVSSRFVDDLGYYDAAVVFKDESGREWAAVRGEGMDFWKDDRGRSCTEKTSPSSKDLHAARVAFVARMEEAKRKADLDRIFRKMESG